MHREYAEILDEFGLTAFEGKTFLVTGATGFMASYILNFLFFVNLSNIVKKTKENFLKNLGESKYLIY